VIDGDTIEIHGTRIRFYGIDAPESRQTCRDGLGREYRCGQLEDGKLIGMISIGDVVKTRLDELETEGAHMRNFIAGVE
jgi:hypothetical protein